MLHNEVNTSLTLPAQALSLDTEKGRVVCLSSFVCKAASFTTPLSVPDFKVTANGLK